MAAFVLVASGCGNSSPRITNEQVVAWERLAAETVPAAEEITIDTDYVTTMANSSNTVTIDMVFANMADWKASTQAIVALQDAVDHDAPGASIMTSVENVSADAHDAELGAKLAAEVPAVSGVMLLAGQYVFDRESDAFTTGTLYLYLDDEAKFSPDALDQIAGIVQADLEGIGGRLVRIYVLPPSAVDLVYSDPTFEETAITVRDIEAFKDFGVDGGCVRTERWAYDVETSVINVYDIDDPGGACS